MVHSSEMPQGSLSSRLRESVQASRRWPLEFVRSATSALSWLEGNTVLNIVGWIVFAILDVTDQLLCPVFAFLDFFLDSEKSECYCDPSHCEIQQSADEAATFGGKESLSRLFELSQEGAGAFGGHGGYCMLESCWTRGSDSRYAHVRRLGRTRFHFLTLHRTISSGDNTGIIEEQIPHVTNGAEETILLPVGGARGGRGFSDRHGVIVPTANSHLRNLTEWSVKSVIARQRSVRQVARWSDCGCQRCTSWQSDKDQLLYVHVDDKDFVASVGNELIGANISAAENNIIFLHGFLSSSSFWAGTVLPALPDSVRTSHRLFAVDILGFGRSPKPSNSLLYTLAGHIDMIRRSVLEPYGIESFHLVAHSMGCTIALALAAHDPSALKSITLIAPPYCPDLSRDCSSIYVMEQLSARKIWPLITFGNAVMSWYEHVGRVVCFVVCKHHRLWEPLLRFVYSTLPGKRPPLSSVIDFTQHTHSSAWHIYHNTICNGCYAADHSFEVLQKAGKRVRVIHGTRDAVVPFKTSVSLCERHPNVRLTAVTSADHGTVVFGREAELAEELAEEIFIT